MRPPLVDRSARTGLSPLDARLFVGHTRSASHETHSGQQPGWHRRTPHDCVHKRAQTSHTLPDCEAPGARHPLPCASIPVRHPHETRNHSRRKDLQPARFPGLPPATPLPPDPLSTLLGDFALVVLVAIQQPKKTPFKLFTAKVTKISFYLKITATLYFVKR